MAERDHALVLRDGWREESTHNAEQLASARETIAGLREALEDARNTAVNSRLAYRGAHRSYTPQIAEEQVGRWTLALDRVALAAAAPSIVVEGESPFGKH